MELILDMFFFWVVYLTALDVWMTDERIIGKDLEGIRHGPIEILIRHLHGGN
jgi:hypothetical protein